VTKQHTAAGETPFFTSLPSTVLQCLTATGVLPVLKHRLTPALRTELYHPINNQHHQQARELITQWQQQNLSAMPGHPASWPQHDDNERFSLILLHQQSERELHQLIVLAIGTGAGDWDDGSDKFSQQLVVYSAKPLSKLAQYRVKRKWPLLQLHFVFSGHPGYLLRQADNIVSDGGWFTLEAILAGRNVQQSHGSVFTALCNSSGDERQALLERLVHQLWQVHADILLPETASAAVNGKPAVAATIAELFNWLALQQQQLSRLPPTFYVHRMARLWRPVLRRFAPYSKVHFVRHARQIPAGSHVLLWGRRELDSPAPADLNIIRIEDGFIRSVGLGAQFVTPVSWVFDHQGIYFDSTAESELEQLCNQATFSDTLLKRAEALQHAIVAANITKYNTGQGSWQRPAGRRVVLVPGQVESDASIRFGAADIRHNLALLKAVRANCPDAYLLYKPHPDVVVKARAQGDGEQLAGQYCDEIISNVGMAQLLSQVDEVHVLTSLTGFEALLRGIPVYCYGRPFYAGWGLTQDQVSQLRRERTLTLAQLVAAALILYPVYISTLTGCYTSPENILNELALLRTKRQLSLADLKRRIMRTAVNLLVKPT